MRLSLICIFCLHLAFAQQAKVALSDYHAAQITDIIPTLDGKGFITADQSGKILLYDLDTYSYKRTIKPSDGYFLENMQLLGEKGAIVYKSKDSLFYLDYNSSETLGKSAFKGSIVNQTKSRYKVFTTSEDYYTHILLVLDLANSTNVQLKTKQKVVSAYITEDNNHIIYVEQKMHPADQNMVCVNLTDKTVVWEQSLESKYKVVKLFNATDTTTIEAVAFSEEDDIMAVFTYNKGIPTAKPATSISYPTTLHSIRVADYFKKDKLVVLTTSMMSLYPLLLTYEKGTYAFKRCEVDQTYEAVLYDNAKKELLFANNLINFNEGIAKIKVFDAAKFKVKDVYPHISTNFYVGSFLPDDNWMVYGNEIGAMSTNVKYYSSGTFYDRYAQFNFNDYLQQNFKIQELNRNISHYNFTTGKVAFFHSNYSTGQNTIYQYDLINDKLDVLYDLKKDYLQEVLDYNEKTKTLLLSKERYNNYGYVKPQAITFIKDQKRSELSGLYKEVKISNNGNYILTINENNVAEILDVNQNNVFKLELTKGNYTLFAVEDTGFMIANAFSSISYDKCNKETIILDLDDSKKYIYQKHDCAYVTNVSYKNETLALFMENVGLMIKDKLMPVYFAKPPKAISLNEDATKIMVSFADGKISIYDTNTFEELGAMFHPSDKEHIFYSSNGYYFSNTDASNFLFASNATGKISLDQADKEVFNPKEVLSVFGKPNEEYVAVLSKAIELRSSKKNLDVNYKQKAPKTTITNTSIVDNTNTKSNLYVLAVGVSDYEQNEYSLTFADKDALDIANLYGNLDATTEAYYKKKFFGKKFTLNSLLDKESFHLKKHLETYSSVGKLFSISTNNKKWIEIGYENAFIWDFEQATVEPIQLPEGFKLSTYSMNDVVYVNPDSEAFYINDADNVFYQLNPKSKSFDKITLPFNVKENFQYDLIQPIVNNKWVYFDDKRDGTIQLSVGNVNSTKVEEITIDLKNYKEQKSLKLVEDEYVFNPNFKCVSLNGKQLIYTANDKTFIVDMKNKAVPSELPIKIEYGDEVTFSGDKITVLQSTGDNYHNKITTYSFEGKELYTETFNDRDFTIKGVSIYDSKPCWIKESKGLLESNGYSSDNTLDNFTPFSFEKVEVKYLINDNATSKAIKDNLESFFSKVNPQDEVIVFLAGHGVLDSNNNYYYAPHDMDFSNVSKKGVGFDFIINKLKESPSKNKLLLMDSCHSGNTLDLASSETNTSNEPAAKGERGSKSKATNQKKSFKMSDMVNSVFDDFLSTSGVTILSASSGGDVAYENETLGNGAFTTAYLKVLDSKLGGFLKTEENTKQDVVLTENIISEIMKEVANLTNGKQIPDIREMNKNVALKLW
ncbi:caspase family protein [uncultured Flavobacterium sp.]|uniref:caspase family protein n=1 Tax=uncultured Flavobacterium sp. TaxID=165435 RepID=UPI0030C7C7DC